MPLGTFISSTDMDSLSLQVNYDRPVFVKPDREFDCPVCMQTVWQAVQTPCGHRLCDFCFMGLVSETGRALCPVADEECEMLTSNPKNVSHQIIQEGGFTLFTRSKNHLDRNPEDVPIYTRHSLFNFQNNNVKVHYVVVHCLLHCNLH